MKTVKVGMAEDRTMVFKDVAHVEVNSASDLKIYKDDDNGNRELHAFFPNGSYRYFLREEDDTA